MNATTRLLQLLGSPFAPTTTIKSDEAELTNFFERAEKNRMLFHFLENISKNNIDSFTRSYEKEKARHLKIDDAIARVSQVLTDAHIKNALFKTIRPYKSTTVDLDVLIFEDEDYTRSIERMQKVGYKLIVKGPRSTTFWDKKGCIGIDLYRHVAVSFIIYIRRQALVSYITKRELANGKLVQVLKPEADLACVIAHSVIKEQMYTLSEYYTFIYYLKEINIEDFLSITRKNNITNAVRTHATITALLHSIAHKTTPEGLQKILERLGEDKSEKARITENNFDTPHKYNSATLLRSLIEIAKGRETRASMVIQLAQTLNPNLTKDFLRKLINHAFRKTY